MFLVLGITLLIAGAGEAAISGVVRDPQGKPVAGALVAAVAYGGAPDVPGSRAAALVKSDASGRFAFSSLAAGKYGITATRAGLTAAYRGDITVAGGHTPAPVELTLGGPSAKLTGVAKTPEGTPVEGAELRAIRFSDVDGDLFFALTGPGGNYELLLPPARYSILIVQGDRLLEQRIWNADPQLQEPAPAEVVEWMKTNAIPLTTVEAGRGYDELLPLEKIIGPARVVALGEATHGTREFFQFKHRMLEYLVDRLGFDTFAIEATMPESFDIDEYVLTGKGDPEKALAGIYFWTWNTEEVLELIRWMRRWNADPAHKKKLRFLGFDMQSAARAARVVREYLIRTGVPQPVTALEPFASELAEKELLAAPYDQKDRVVAAVDALAKQFETAQADWSKRTSPGAFRFARQHLRILQQHAEHAAARDGGGRVRDRAMADNIRWILDTSRDTKIVVWAHNGHVAARKTGEFEWMGLHLRNALGANYKIFGFAFNEGSFQSGTLPYGPLSSVRDFTVTPGPPGSLDVTLARTKIPLFALDLAAPKPPGVAAWFDKGPFSRSIGSGYEPAMGEAAFFPEKVLSSYDALVFFDKTTSARPNALARREARTILARPENLDFEAGLAPWYAPPLLIKYDYRVEPSADRPRQGKSSLAISRGKGRHYGEKAGLASQIIDATEYRGKRVRFSAEVRVRAAKGRGRAHLWISAASEQSMFGLPSLYDVGPELDAPDWSTAELIADIPAGAQRIELGLAFIGEGTASFDNVGFAPQQQEGSNMRVLFIGNSFTFGNDLPQLLRKLAKESGLDVAVRVHAQGGATLEQHAASAEVKELLGQRWDYVVLQEQSQIPALDTHRKQSMSPALATLGAAAKAGGNRLLLFSTWGYQNGDRITLPSDNYAAMQARLDAGFAEQSKLHGLPIVPVGAAWAEARRARPELNLWSGDGKHPALEGSYLAACVFYSHLFQRSPRGNRFHGGLSADTAQLLQDIAERAAKPARAP